MNPSGASSAPAPGTTGPTRTAISIRPTPYAARYAARQLPRAFHHPVVPAVCRIRMACRAEAGHHGRHQGRRLFAWHDISTRTTERRGLPRRQAGHRSGHWGARSASAAASSRTASTTTSGCRTRRRVTTSRRSGRRMRSSPKAAGTRRALSSTCPTEAFRRRRSPRLAKTYQVGSVLK